MNNTNELTLELFTIEKLKNLTWECIRGSTISPGGKKTKS